MPRFALLLSCLVLAAAPASAPAAQTPRGHLVVVGGGGTPQAALQRALELAGGPQAAVLVVPQASATGTGSTGQWDRLGAQNTSVLTMELLADPPAAVRAVEAADLIWMPGGQQGRLMRALQGAPGVVEAIRKRYQDGAVVGGTSAGAAVMSEIMISGGGNLTGLTPRSTNFGSGLALWTEVLVDQHFFRRQRTNRLISAVLDHPQRVGVGIDEGTACVVSGDVFEVVGRSGVIVFDARNAQVERSEDDQPLGATGMATHVLRPGMRFDLATGTLLTTDLPAAPVPTGRPAAPPRGALVMVGGGTTEGIARRTLELAGGPEARVLIVPFASESPEAAGPERMFREAGAREVSVLSVEDSAAAVAAVEQADLVWLAGGSQNRLVETLTGTGVPEALSKRYQEGAVIGGNSAGASALARVMLTGEAELRDITQDTTATAPGLALAPELLIDQHFSQRQRFNRLMSLVLDRPGLIGLGLDENTAAVLRGGALEVIGERNVVVLDARLARGYKTQRGENSAGAGVVMHVLRPGMRLELSPADQDLPPRTWERAPALSLD